MLTARLKSERVLRGECFFSLLVLHLGLNSWSQTSCFGSRFSFPFTFCLLPAPLTGHQGLHVGGVESGLADSVGHCLLLVEGGCLAEA